MITKRFSCETTNYFIEYMIDDENKIASIEYVYCDYKNIKPYVFLLRTSIDALKKDGIKEIKQSVSIYDWNSFLKNKTSWEIIDQCKDTGNYTIICNIDDSIKNIAIGIGLE